MCLKLMNIARAARRWKQKLNSALICLMLKYAIEMELGVRLTSTTFAMILLFTAAIFVGRKKSAEKIIN